MHAGRIVATNTLIKTVVIPTENDNYSRFGNLRSQHDQAQCNYNSWQRDLKVLRTPGLLLQIVK